MTETDIEREPIARQLWDMTQRIAVQVAEKPIVLREAAFAIAARAFADMARDMNVQEDKRDGVVRTPNGASPSTRDGDRRWRESAGWERIVRALQVLRGS